MGGRVRRVEENNYLQGWKAHKVKNDKHCEIWLTDVMYGSRRTGGEVCVSRDILDWNGCGPGNSLCSASVWMSLFLRRQRMTLCLRQNVRVTTRTWKSATPDMQVGWVCQVVLAPNVVSFPLFYLWFATEEPLLRASCPMGAPSVTLKKKVLWKVARVRNTLAWECSQIHSRETRWRWIKAVKATFSILVVSVGS